MALENDFLVWCAGGGNAASQASYAASSYILNGVVTGLADPTLFNKSVRQATIMSSVIADLIVAMALQPVIDDGTTATILANFTQAIRAASFPSGAGANIAAGGTVTGNNAGTICGLSSSATINVATFVAWQTIGFSAGATAANLTLSSGFFYGAPGISAVATVQLQAGSNLYVQYDGINFRVLTGFLTAVGGVLTGTLPDPGLAAGVAAGNVGALGGVLTGTLPYPGLAGGVAVANLGFTPVQQGGGTGQGTNKVYLGWDGTHALPRIQIDASDQGNIAMMSQFSSSLGVPGWKIYPDPNSPTGYIMEQWGIFSGLTGTANNIFFPIAFPNGVESIQVTDNGDSAYSYGAQIQPGNGFFTLWSTTTASHGGWWLAKGY